ncbi:hypothetical protein Bca52824_064011 [Brassica carinata]|uniref:Uncharacterized protein n=1 Tax=Brassica carinata TaxID=52824 RepID=A0A8X7QFI7_BRACI|nr:hypothetical protein Bca52824_064011 [Brassica carinata]
MMNVEYCGTITCGKSSIEKIKDEMIVSGKECLDGESPKEMCDEHLESDTMEKVSRATKAAHDKKKMMKKPHPPPLDMLPHTLTLHPMKFKDGTIEYKIKCKGKSTPFSSAKAIITPQLQDDPIKLQELLSQVLTITLECGKDPLLFISQLGGNLWTSLGEFSKIPKGHVENFKVTTSPPSSFLFSHQRQLQVSAFYLCQYLVIMFLSFP